MSATMYYEADANPMLVAQRKVAVLGFGSQGHAHALNLKESGVDVAVGLRPGSRRESTASDAGLHVMTPAAATEWADLTMVLVPDQFQGITLRRGNRPNPQGWRCAVLRSRLQYPLRLRDSTRFHRCCNGRT